MYDLEEYKNGIRDFYIKLDELPGPVIENGKNGLIIEKTPQNLYDSLNQLKDETFYNSISLNARKSFEKEFSKKQEFKTLGEIVRKYVRN